MQLIRVSCCLPAENKTSSALCRPACQLANEVEMHLGRQAGSRPQIDSRELSGASLRVKTNNGIKAPASSSLPSPCLGALSVPAESQLHRTQRDDYTNIKALSPRRIGY